MRPTRSGRGCLASSGLSRAWMVEPTKISYREWYRLRSRRPTALARGAVDLGEFSTLSADAILSIQPRVLRGKLRHITQVTNWSGLSLSPLLRGAVVAIIYFAFAKVSLTLASLHPSASPVWPPSGLALAS